ncbi:hypothetical protein LBMAG56_18430 [Verrucomicrobiota bacterium]|nr:hypothetical protein LBMAG56_18430 [Verrucomicrobiota bacterium]
MRGAWAETRHTAESGRAQRGEAATKAERDRSPVAAATSEPGRRENFQHLREYVAAAGGDRPRAKILVARGVCRVAGQRGRIHGTAPFGENRRSEFGSGI